MRHFGVVINLSGGMRNEALESWATLEEQFKIRHISSQTVSPHITLSSGHCSEPGVLLQRLEGLAATRPFEIQGNGLGVFVQEAPVIYIRWLHTMKLMDLYKRCNATLNDFWVNPSVNNEPERWQAKATLACHDSSYDQLGTVLDALKRFNFKQPMAVNGLSILEITENNETLMGEIPFC